MRMSLADRPPGSDTETGLPLARRQPAAPVVRRLAAVRPDGRAIALVLLLVVVVFAIALIARALAATPTLSLTPAIAQAGASVSVAGSGFEPGQDLGLAFDDSTAEMPSFRTTSDGTFTQTITVPAVIAGPHTITARPTPSGPAIASTALAVVASAATPTDAPPTTITLSPTADATIVETGEASAASRLYVDGGDGSAAMDTLIRFEVPSTCASPTSAKLTLTVGDGEANPSASGGDVYGTVDNGWTEEAVTWVNAPAPVGLPVATLGAVALSTAYTVDVTSLVTAPGAVTIRAGSTTSDAAAYVSREGSTTSGPRLEVTCGSSTAAGGSPSPPATESTVLLAAGDIASCSNDDDEATARILDATVGTVIPLGDLAYDDGTATQFAECYDPTWGRHKDRTKPAPGNHEYNTSGAAAYYDYFGPTAGDPQKGYYAFDAGPWRVYALNSNCTKIGGCGVGSVQERWLRADLAANTRSCVLAYWHHPLFSSGQHGNHPIVAPLWQALQDADADVVLSGHDHTYERFAPQDATGVADPAGMTEFVVGTGGRNHYSIGTIEPNSEVRDNKTFGVLQLALRPDGLDYRFLPVPGSTFTDSGSIACH
jgi:hypothetical protein